MCVMMTEIKTIEGGQKRCLLTRGNKKKRFLKRKMHFVRKIISVKNISFIVVPSKRLAKIPIQF